MHRKAILSLLIAAALMALLAAAVGAQETPEAAATEVAVEEAAVEDVAVEEATVAEIAEGLETSIEPLVAFVTQTVPLTLTVNISGPDGIQAVAVPVWLNLAIRLAFTDQLTATIAATTEVALPVEEVEAEEPPAPAPTATPVPVTPTPTPVPPTATPAAPTPRPLAPTATPVPAEDAEATATPIAEDEEAAEEEAAEEPAEVIAPPAACPDPRAVIFSPGANATISGTVEIFGTAQHENFQYYKLEYEPGANIDPAAEFAFLTDVNQPVAEGLLATVNTAVFDNGPYTLRLTVVDRTGNFPPPCTVTVQIQN